MKKIAIILAGGEGTRAGGNLPKQFQELLGKPMYMYSMEAFLREDPSTELMLVCHPGMFDLLDIQMSEREEPLPYILICGGRTRRESVAHALMELRDTAPGEERILVAVHDSARPLIDEETIRRGWDTALRSGNGVPAVPVTDSLRKIGTEGGSEAVKRADFVAVQTPQIFSLEILLKAYGLEDSPLFTDDASMVEALGEKIVLYRGNSDNIKVTNPEDFAVAETLLRLRRQRRGSAVKDPKRLSEQLNYINLSLHQCFFNIKLIIIHL